MSTINTSYAAMQYTMNAKQQSNNQRVLGYDFQR